MKKLVPEKDPAAEGTAQVWDLEALTLPPEQVAAGQAAYAKRRTLAWDAARADAELARIEARADVLSEAEAEEEARADVLSEAEAEEEEDILAQDARDEAEADALEEAEAEAEAEWWAKVDADADPEAWMWAVRVEAAPAPEPEHKITAEEKRAFDLAVRAWQDQAKR